MSKGDPLSVLLDVSKHSEEEYIWFMCGDPNGF